jgi:hypothetical protein
VQDYETKGESNMGAADSLTAAHDGDGPPLPWRKEVGEPPALALVPGGDVPGPARIGGRFAPGHCPNPGGLPKGARRRDALEALRELRTLARDHAPKAIETAVAILEDDAARPGDRLKAGQIILEWAFGKPENATEIQGEPRDYAELPLGDQREIMRRALVAIDEKLSAGASEKGDAA